MSCAGLMRVLMNPSAKASPGWLSSGSGGPSRLLDTLIWTSIAEPPVRALVRQGSRCLAARDFDVVEQTPL